MERGRIVTVKNRTLCVDKVLKILRDKNSDICISKPVYKPKSGEVYLFRAEKGENKGMSFIMSLEKKLALFVGEQISQMGPHNYVRLFPIGPYITVIIGPGPHFM